jgi:hypothetical protein
MAQVRLQDGAGSAVNTATVSRRRWYDGTPPAPEVSCRNVLQEASGVTSKTNLVVMGFDADVCVHINMFGGPEARGMSVIDRDEFGPYLHHT